MPPVKTKKNVKPHGRGKGKSKSTEPVATTSKEPLEASTDDVATSREAPEASTEATTKPTEVVNAEDSDRNMPAAKRARLATDLTPEEEDSMVEWLKDQPILYNKKLKSYKDTTKKDKMWEDKAAEMDRPVLLLKTWYSSLRTRFGRIRKKKSGEATDSEMSERDIWIMRHFDFLRPHIHEVVKKPLVSILQKLHSISPSEDDGDQLQVSETASVNPCVSATATVTKDMRQTPTDKDEALLSGIEERGQKMIDLQQQLLERLKPSGDREREAFVDWIRSVILDLDQVLWRRCQQDISATLYRYITENDAINRSSDARQVAQHPASHPNNSISQQVVPQTPHLWQPHPSQWPSQFSVPNTSVWQSMDSSWVQQHFPHDYQRSGPSYSTPQLQPVRSQSAGPIFGSNTPTGPSPIPPADNSQEANSSDFSISQFLQDDSNSATGQATRSTQPSQEQQQQKSQQSE